MFTTGGGDGGDVMVERVTTGTGGAVAVGQGSRAGSRTGLFGARTSSPPPGEGEGEHRRAAASSFESRRRGEMWWDVVLQLPNSLLFSCF
jgi:hypothetical protein